MQLYEVIRRPIVTEKNTALQEQSKYTFEVARESDKHQIRQAVEKAFKVKVIDVNVMIVPGKSRRVGRRQVTTAQWKKAIVTLKEGQKIQIFEGV